MEKKQFQVQKVKQLKRKKNNCPKLSKKHFKAFSITVAHISMLSHSSSTNIGTDVLAVVLLDAINNNKTKTIKEKTQLVREPNWSKRDIMYCNALLVKQISKVKYNKNNFFFFIIINNVCWYFL